MFKIKMMVSIGLLTTALIFPTSAFASTGTTYHSQSSFQSFFNQLLNCFGNNQTSQHDEDDSKIKDNAQKWWDEHKNDCPSEDSYQIWERWYCS